MTHYQVTFCTTADANSQSEAEAMIRQAVGDGHVPARIQTIVYPKDTDLKLYEVTETIVYGVKAVDAQDAIDQVIDDCLDPKFQVAVTRRTIIDGPDGWEDEEYDSP